jgi:hypothetical protein
VLQEAALPSPKVLFALRGFQEMSQCGWATATRASSTLRGRVQMDRRVATRMSRLLAERYLTELVEPAGPSRVNVFYLFIAIF